MDSGLVVVSLRVKRKHRQTDSRSSDVALILNLHFHTVVVDGVFVREVDTTFLRYLCSERT